MKPVTDDVPESTIGNGVVIAHATTTSATGALVVLAGLDVLAGLAVFLVLFAAVFVGDMWLKHRGPVPARSAAHDATPADD